MIVVFEKSMAVRHIGHLDLMRAVQRALRRSGLPICYSNGFNPHIQLSFASPLSVGVVGLRELMDVPVEGECDPAIFAQTLSRALPPALRVIGARAVADDYPTLMALVSGSVMRIEMDATPETAKIAAAFRLFMAGEECVTLRRTKSAEKQTNIRPFIQTGEVKETDAGVVLRCVVRNRQDGSLKPSVLMRALCEMAEVETVDFIAYREQILAMAKDGRAIPLEEYENG